MAMTEFDARQLVEAHQAGDDHAFTEIARFTYPSLYSSARRRLIDHHAAEDAVQETFARAFRALPRFDGDFRLQAWLHRILVNVCSDEGSRRSREIHLVERVGSLADEGVADPADLTIVSDECTFVASALAELPDGYRTAVALRYLDDLSYRDIAVATGVSEQNARARASRGRAVLQRVLGQGMAGLVLVFPSLRRSPRTAVAVDPPAAVSSTGLADQVGQLAVTNAATTPLSNLTASLASHVAQAAPAVTRLAEVSASMGGGRSSMVANVVGAVAAVMMPVAASTMLDSHPAAPSVEVATAAVTAGDVGDGLASLATTTIAGSTTEVSGAPAASTEVISTVATATTIPSLVGSAPAKSSAPPPVASDPAGAGTDPAVNDPGTGTAELARPAGRHGGIVSDGLTVVADGSGFRLSGPIGFAIADKDADAGLGQDGMVSGSLAIEEPSADGSTWVVGELEIVIDGRAHELRLEGRVVEESTGDGATTYRFSGSYHLTRAADLGLDRRGDVSWTLVAADVAADGDASPCSTLRISLGDQPEPVEGDAR